MADLDHSQTLRHLLDHLARDAQALVRYRMFAVAAAYEGRRESAELFTRLAQNHAVFAEGHLEFIRAAHDPLSGQPFGLTAENLAAALHAERQDADALAPDLAGIADAEGFPAIASWFRTVAVAKREHVGRLHAMAAPAHSSGLAETVSS